MFGPSLACLANPDPADGGVEVETIAAQYGKAWTQLLTAVCAVFFLIGTEEVARATISHPASAASFGDAQKLYTRNKARTSAAMAHAGNYGHRKAKCPGCGAVVSMREIMPDAISDRPGAESLAQDLAHYEFTIRMSDGSTRVITGINSEAWREGERVTVIDPTTVVASRRQVAALP